MNVNVSCVTIKTGNDSVLSVDFHPRAPILALACFSNIDLYTFSNLSAPVRINRLTNCKRTVNSVAFHSSMPFLAAGSNDGIFVWLLSPDCSTATCVISLNKMNGGHNDAVKCVAFHPTQLILASGSKDQTVKLWRLVQNDVDWGAECLTTLSDHKSYVLSVTFHPTLPLMATGSDDTTAKLWHFNSDVSSELKLSCVSTIDRKTEGHREPVLSLSFHSKLPILATGSSDATVKLWSFKPNGSHITCLSTLDKTNGGHSVPLFKHSANVNSVVFHPTESIFATASDDNTVKLWALNMDFLSAKCLTTVSNHRSGVMCVAFHREYPFFASGSNDNTVSLCECSSLTQRRQLHKTSTALGAMTSLLSKRLAGSNSRSIVSNVTSNAMKNMPWYQAYPFHKDVERRIESLSNPMKSKSIIVPPVNILTIKQKEAKLIKSAKQKTPKTSPKTRKSPPKTPKTSPKTHKSPPKTPKTSPKTSPKTRKSPPKTPKTSPKTPKTSPKTHKSPPKTPKTSPKNTP